MYPYIRFMHTICSYIYKSYIRFIYIYIRFMFHTIYVHTFVPRALPYNEPVPFPKLGPRIAHAMKICTGKPFPNPTCIRVGLAS